MLSLDKLLSYQSNRWNGMIVFRKRLQSPEKFWAIQKNYASVILNYFQMKSNSDLTSIWTKKESVAWSCKLFQDVRLYIKVATIKTKFAWISKENVLIFLWQALMRFNIQYFYYVNILRNMKVNWILCTRNLIFSYLSTSRV